MNRIILISILYCLVVQGTENNLSDDEILKSYNYQYQSLFNISYNLHNIEIIEHLTGKLSSKGKDLFQIIFYALISIRSHNVFNNLRNGVAVLDNSKFQNINQFMDICEYKCNFQDIKLVLNLNGQLTLNGERFISDIRANIFCLLDELRLLAVINDQIYNFISEVLKTNNNYSNLVFFDSIKNKLDIGGNKIMQEIINTLILIYQVLINQRENVLLASNFPITMKN